MRPWYRFLFFSLILSSCSRLQMAYKLADDYILHQANSFFDLSDDQYKTYKSRVEKDIDRIKTTELPKASAYLKTIKSEVKTGLTSQKIDLLYEDGQKLFSRVIHEFETTAYDFSREMNTEQIENFKDEYNERLNDLKEDVDSPKERFKHQRKRVTKWMKEWVGSVSRDQEKAIEQFIDSNPYPYELQIKHRQLMRDKFLEARKDPIRLKEFLAKIDLEKDTSYAGAMKIYTPGLKKFLLNLYTSLSEKQKNYLIGRLDTRIGQLEEIAKN
jgi:hypothetical protein